MNAAPQTSPLPQAPMAQPASAGPAGGAPQLPPGAPTTIDAVMRLIRDKALVKFRVDIEADSTIAGDESQEKQDRAQLIESITKLVEVWGPIITAQPIMAPLASALLTFGVRAFRVGRTLETVIEETADKLIEVMGQPKPAPQPSPDDLVKLQGVKAKVAAEIQKARIGMETAKIDAQAKVATIQQTAQASAQDHAQSVRQGAIDAQLADQQARNDAASQQMKAQVEEMRFRRAVDAEHPSLKPDDKSRL